MSIGTKSKTTVPYVWDYNIDKQTFLEILSGSKEIGRLNREWAILRLLEYAPYDEIIQLIGFPTLVEGWPQWRDKIRAKNRRRGFDFLAEWLPQHHPELLNAAGIFPPDLARVLDSITYDDWQVIRWINPPEPDRFIADLKGLAEKLIMPD